MAVVDADLKRHQDTWHAFTKFLKWSCILVALTLIFMALFLL